MNTFAVKYGNRSMFGSWGQCVNHAHSIITNRPSAVVKILRARAGEKLARIVAEVTSEGVRFIERGRVINVSRLKGDVRG